LDDKRLTQEELSALFEEAPSLEEEVEAAEVDGIPPEVVPPFVAIARRLLLESFQDLDDFLDLPLECGEPIATTVPPGDVLRLAEGGVWARFEWSGPAEGAGWLVLPEISARRLLARLLGSRDEKVKGTLGRLHRTSLEGPFSELQVAMERHLEEEDLHGRVHLDPPTLEAPRICDDELRLLRLECPFKMGESPLVVCFYAEEGLAACLARIELEQRSLAIERAASIQADAEAIALADAEANALAEAFTATSGSDEEEEALLDLESASEVCEMSAFLGRAVLEGGMESLQEGMVFKLDRLAGDLVEIQVDGEAVGVGRVVVVEDHYGVRIQRLTPPRRRE
jgi:flagellar motor switch/type III secretory pathway protein FliN